MGKTWFSGKIRGLSSAVCALLTCSACATIYYNKEYSGARFPADIEISAGVVNVTVKDVSGMSPATEPAKNELWSSILDGFRGNSQGLNFSVAEGIRSKEADAVTAIAELPHSLYTNSLPALLYEDAHHNEESGMISAKILDIPFMRNAFAADPRYLAFFEYRGTKLSDAYLALQVTGSVLAAIVGSSQEFDTDHSTIFTFVILDKELGKYVYWDRDESTDDPTPKATADAHVAIFLRQMKRAMEGKEG
jgi:hypothetical protein